MKIKPLIIGDLVTRLPIIQGGMGIGISLSNLAGNVAKYGAIGVISAAHAGYMEADFKENSTEANIRGLKKHIKKAKEISSNGIIGVNIMVATNYYKEHVKAAIEGGADLIISGAGLPLNLPEFIGKSLIKIAPIVSSAKATNVILKYWHKHYNKSADAIIVEGPLAGGHLGFKKDSLEYEISNFYNNVKEVINEVSNFEKLFNKKIPIIVGGGIFTSDDVKKYLNLGASGVQVGTRFVATNECDAHINFKMAYINSTENDIELVKSPVGMPGRAIKNKFSESIKEKKSPVKKCYNCLIPCKPATTPYCISDALISAVKGDIDNGLIFCGSNAYKINSISSVHDVLLDLTRDIEIY